MKKYNYFKKDIKSAEDFITLCATQSTMSNQPYLIKCPGNKIVEASGWLLLELNRFRKKEP